MHPAFLRISRLVKYPPLTELIANPAVKLLLSYACLGLVYFLVRQRPNESYVYFYAWKLAGIDGLLFLAISPNEPKIKGVMIGVIIALAVICLGFYGLRLLGVEA